MFATFNSITAQNIAATEDLINDLQAELEAARQQLARSSKRSKHSLQPRQLLSRR
ncbi:hypothetical protein F7734_58570 [Scytonema sp. UIC 10036]|uniref:hypothetical protein n=1 Tax=Scytonema sp. UIC 10036 TaxID=2304196 RepID=UPI0012DABDD9|nr:hypothetical protein [Scytonema sp. UIC 10036]MUH01553.1 hypothetical protein [Scytonema sp. UIC 10036]